MSQDLIRPFLLQRMNSPVSLQFGGGGRMEKTGSLIYYGKQKLRIAGNDGSMTANWRYVDMCGGIEEYLTLRLSLAMGGSYLGSCS